MTDLEIIQSAYDALYAYLSATNDDDEEKARQLIAKSFFELKERLGIPSIR